MCAVWNYYGILHIVCMYSNAAYLGYNDRSVVVACGLAANWWDRIVHVYYVVS